MLDECQPILVNQTKLPYGWEFSENPYAVPGISEGGRGNPQDGTPTNDNINNPNNHDHHYGQNDDQDDRDVDHYTGASSYATAEVERPVAPEI